MKTVILKAKHGDYVKGQELEVIRTGTTTTICRNPDGGRTIIPNSKLEGGVKLPVMEITPDENSLILDRLREGDSPSDIMHDEDLLDEDSIRAMETHMKAGGKFKVTHAPSRPEVGISMSDAEARILEELMEKKGVTSDAPKEPEPEPEPDPEVGEHQILFTDITGGRKPKSGINHIIDVYPDDYFPEEIRCDIPGVDDTHFWDTEVLEALVLGYSLDEKVCITGLPGTGKTSSVRQFCAWIRQPYIRLGGRGDLESASFLGSSWVDTEEVDGQLVSKMSFKPGMLTQALDYHGFGYYTTIDEAWKIPPYIQMAMQHLYEKDGYLTLDDKPGAKADKVVKPAKEFRLVLTDNVKGTGDSFDKFAATQMQDSSSLDRININEELDYLSQVDETSMIMGRYPGASEPAVKKLVQFAGLVRNAYRQGSVALTLSPRGLISILEMAQKGIPMLRAIDLAFMNKIADEAEQIAIKGMLKTVGIR